MRRLVSILCSLTLVCIISLPVLAATSTVESHIYYSGGGTGYSDGSTQLYNSYLIVPGSNLHYDKFKVGLYSFMFDYYPQNTKPNSNVKFNFRLCKTNSNGTHTDCASLVKLSSLSQHNPEVDNGGSAWLWENGGNSGDKNAMKTNASGYSATGCGVTCEWYLFMT